MELLDSKSISEDLNFRSALFLPLILSYKLMRTFFRALGLALSLSFLLLTFGSSNGAREFFLHRTSTFAADLADWVIYPLALLSRVVRMCFSCIRHTL